MDSSGSTVVEESRALTGETSSARPQPNRRTAALLITPIICLVIAAYVGDALTTTWARDHPLALLALNARNRIVLLVTNQLDPVSYYVVGTLRLLLSDPLFFLLGLNYGDRAIQWIERQSSFFGEQVRVWEKGFTKASYPLVFLAPNNIICLFAGASGMPLPAFIVLNVTGTIGRLYLLRVVGDVFADPISSVLDFFGHYRWPLLALSVGTVALVLLLERRKGKGEILELLELEQELDAASGNTPDGDRASGDSTEASGDDGTSQ